MILQRTVDRRVPQMQTSVQRRKALSGFYIKRRVTENLFNTEPWTAPLDPGTALIIGQWVSS